MFGNQVKAWFEINSRRIDKETREDIKKQFKEKLGLTAKADPYNGQKADDIVLLFCPYDSVDEKSEYGCKKDFVEQQANINISKILREKVLKKLFNNIDFLNEIREQYDRKFTYGIFAAVQQDLDSKLDNEQAIDFSFDNDIISFLVYTKAYNTLLVEPYHSED